MAFTPTHTVPGSGMRAWATPDPSQEPVATLGAGLELQVVERRGQWAQVEASNGWTGWVDGNLLVERPAQPQPAEPTTPQPEAQPQPTSPAPVATRPAPEPPTGEARRWGVGASLLLVVATLLAWDRPLDVDFGGQNFSAWDFPLTFLLDFENIFEGTKGVSIGLFLTIVAVVAFAFVNSGRAAVVWRVAGAVTLLTALLHAVQAQRLVSDFDDGWVLDVLGPGFYLAVVAGVGFVLAPSRPQVPSETTR